MSKISDNVERVKEEVAQAVEAAGRGAEEVKILAATKYTDRAGVVELIEAGIVLIGENRIQDALAKLEGVEESGQVDIHDEFPECRVHMIGHVQKNKINHALKLFDLIETIDAVKLADALEQRLAARERTLECLVEVHLTEEEAKTGCRPEYLPSLLEYIWENCPHIDLRGLMGMGPWDPDPEVARPYYRKLREVFNESVKNAPSPGVFDTISMGMSADFHVAIQEGATLVRIGRRFFE